MTRDVTRPKALELQRLGAEVVKGDLNDKASVDSALKGAYGAFLVTNFWDALNKDKEVFQVETKFFLFSFEPFPLTLPSSFFPS